jgi:hypothetical protein
MATRLASVLFMLTLSTGGCFSFSQFDDEEAARNRREWTYERDHILDPVAFHASDQPEGLDPPGPKPLLGPRRDPDTIPRQGKSKQVLLDGSRDAWDEYRFEHLEER